MNGIHGRRTFQKLTVIYLFKEVIIYVNDHTFKNIFNGKLNTFTTSIPKNMYAIEESNLDKHFHFLH